MADVSHVFNAPHAAIRDAIGETEFNGDPGTVINGVGGVGGVGSSYSNDPSFGGDPAGTAAVPEP